MTLEVRTRLYSTITVGGLALSFFVAFVVPFPQRISAFDRWQTGDWLINFEGGLVRRGVVGETLFSFLPTASTLIAATAILQLILAGFIYLAAGLLYWRSDRGTAWMMTVLSPAFLLFPALDLAANSRKELLALMALTILALGISFNRNTVGGWLALPLFAVAAFSHEALVLLLPSFLILLLFTPTGRARNRQKMIQAAVFTVIAIAALIFAFAFPGSESSTQKVCESWKRVGIYDCGGALDALDESVQSMQSTLFTENFPTYWLYLIPAGLAVVPFFATRFLPRYWWIAGTLAAALLPLYFVAWDYGRWIYLWAAQMSVISLAWSPRLVRRPMRIPLVLALAFILLWGFNHYGTVMNEGFLLRIVGNALN